LSTGLPLGKGVAAVDDPMAVLPSLFHLMWAGALDADLRGATKIKHAEDAA
jgi:hypothetical protein